MGRRRRARRLTRTRDILIPWAHLVAKNNAARSRRFDYKSCVLDWGPAHAIAARFIAWSLMLGSPGFDWQTEFDASEEKEQWLGFAYPVEYLPTLVACGDNVVKLSYQAGSRAP